MKTWLLLIGLFITGVLPSVASSAPDPIFSTNPRLVFSAYEADGTSEPIAYQFRLTCGGFYGLNIKNLPVDALLDNGCHLRVTSYSKCESDDKGKRLFYGQTYSYYGDGVDTQEEGSKSPIPDFSEYSKLDIATIGPNTIRLHVTGISPILSTATSNLNATIGFEPVVGGPSKIVSFSGVISWVAMKYPHAKKPPSPIQLILMNSPIAKLPRSCPLGLVSGPH